MLTIGAIIWFIIILIILVNLIGWGSLIFVAIFLLFLWINLNENKKKRS